MLYLGVSRHIKPKVQNISECYFECFNSYFENDVKKCSGINWKIVWNVFFGWIITLVVVGGSTGLLVAQGIYAPSKMNEQCPSYNKNITLYNSTI